MNEPAEKSLKSTYKLIDQDHPEIYWIVEMSADSKERIYLEYNFQDLIKGWFSVIPKYLLKNHKVTYGSLYYTREAAEARKVDGNFAVVELIWEEIKD